MGWEILFNENINFGMVHPKFYKKFWNDFFKFVRMKFLGNFWMGDILFLHVSQPKFS